MAGWGLGRRLDTSNLAFNCDDLLSVQSCSPHSAWNSDGARMLLGKLLRLSRVGPDCYRDRCLCRDRLAGKDKDKVVSRLLLAPPQSGAQPDGFITDHLLPGAIA